jgi:hypothetical protein
MKVFRLIRYFLGYGDLYPSTTAGRGERDDEKLHFHLSQS